MEEKYHPFQVVGRINIKWILHRNWLKAGSNDAAAADEMIWLLRNLWFRLQTKKQILKIKDHINGQIVKLN